MVNAKMELHKTLSMNSEEIPNTYVIGHETSVDDWLKETFCTSYLKTDICLAIGMDTQLANMRKKCNLEKPHTLFAWQRFLIFF